MAKSKTFSVADLKPGMKLRHRKYGDMEIALPVNDLLVTADQGVADRIGTGVFPLSDFEGVVEGKAVHDIEFTKEEEASLAKMT